MSLSAVLFLFLTHLGIGIVLTLLLVSREAGVKFFRFNAGLAVVLLVIGLAFRPARGAWTPDAHGLGLAALTLATIALAAYWLTVGRMLARWRAALLRTAAAGGTAALVAEAVALAPAGSTFSVALTSASFLTSAALLGGACTSMILGHWYLVLPSMNVALLQAIVKFHLGSTVVRLAVVGLAVSLALAGWQPGDGPAFARYIWSIDGIFFWQRVLFGLGGPLVLAYLTWETAKISSTQSATGILYVDFFTVIVGEVLAKYLLLATSIPV